MRTKAGSFLSLQQTHEFTIEYTFEFTTEGMQWQRNSNEEEAMIQAVER